MADLADLKFRFRTMVDEARAGLPERSREDLAKFLHEEARQVLRDLPTPTPAPWWVDH